MRTLIALLFIFFVGLGIHRVVQDLLFLIDSDFIVSRSAGYFSVIGFMVLFYGIKFLGSRDEARTTKTGTTNHK